MIVVLEKYFEKLRLLLDKITSFYKPKKIRIDDIDKESEIVKIDKIGITNTGEGVLVLKTINGEEFPFSAFSGEIAKNISDFIHGKQNDFPTIYNVVEQICEETEIVLVKVRIYGAGSALRANLYFTGRKDIILRNYRASDAIALAAFYNIPILVKRDLLQMPKANAQ